MGVWSETYWHKVVGQQGPRCADEKWNRVGACLQAILKRIACEQAPTN